MLKENSFKDFKDLTDQENRYGQKRKVRQKKKILLSDKYY